MIKNLLSIALVATTMCVSAQSFTATYSFAAVTQSTGLTDPSPVPTANGLTFGSFSAVGTPSMNPSGTGRFSFVGWPTGATTGVDTYSTMTGAINTSEYMQVTLTPQSGYVVALNTCAFTVQRSATGSRSYSVRTNADSYVNNLPAVTTSSLISVKGTNEFFFNFDATSSATNGSSINFMGATINSPTTFRFYSWNSEASTGSFGIDNVTFDGTATLSTGLGSVTSDLNARFNVYPVPNNDGIIYIESNHNIEISKIEIIDVLGNVVAKNTESTKKVELNLSHVSGGTYFVRVYANNSVTTQKIIVTK